MSKTFNFGKIDFYGIGRKVNLVTVEVNLRYREDGKPIFTASASVWNIHQTDCVQCGQCLDTIYPFFTDNKLFCTIYKMWLLYHLNNTNCGTVKQDMAIKKHFSYTNQQYEYTKAKEFLKSIDLYNDNGHKYGMGWNYRAIGKKDLKTIEELLK